MQILNYSWKEILSWSGRQSDSKVLAVQAWWPTLDLQNPHEKTKIKARQKEEQEQPTGSLTSQTSLHHDFEASEKLFLQETRWTTSEEWPWRSSSGLYTHAYTRHACMHTHVTHTHTHIERKLCPLQPKINFCMGFVRHTSFSTDTFWSTVKHSTFDPEAYSSSKHRHINIEGQSEVRLREDVKACGHC